MSKTDERTTALCMEIADWLRAVAMDQGEDLTPAERRDDLAVGTTLTSFDKLTDG